jgi:hypothetical protein
VGFEIQKTNKLYRSQDFFRIFEGFEIQKLNRIYRSQDFSRIFSGFQIQNLTSYIDPRIFLGFLMDLKSKTRYDISVQGFF